MLGYNTTLFDDVDKKRQWDRFNELSATCCMKYSDNHYEYIQPKANDNKIDYNSERKQNNDSQDSRVLLSRSFEWNC